MLALSALVGTAFAGEKHFIGHGWDLAKVTTSDMVRNLPELEKLPVDGISITVSKKLPDGKVLFMRNVLSDVRWEKRDYTGEVENLKKISSGRLKHNFLLAFFAPRRRLAWTDDAAWERAAHNVSTFAWIAKTGGLKGVMLDPEDYPKTKQFKLQPGDPAYPEAAALARKRGAQIMKAMGSEFPDMVVLAFEFLGNHVKLNSEDPKRDVALAGELFVPFINGMLDELPPNAIMVDALENGYNLKAATHDFYKLAWELFQTGAKVIEPENLTKFYRQYKMGFGLYLDMYVNGPDKFFYHAPTSGSRVFTLLNNFTEALACADQYCWVYGERYSWIKWDCAEELSKRPMEVNPETWEEKLPGFLESMRFIIDKDQTLQNMYSKMAESGKLVNLVTNPKCFPDKEIKISEGQPDWDTGILPPGWALWRAKPTEGTFCLDTSVGIGNSFSARVIGANNASLIHKLSVKVKPGQFYACEAFKKGGEKSCLRVRWLNNNRWSVNSGSINIPFSAEKDEQGWQRAFGFVKVPHDVNELLLLVYTGLKPDETAWYCNPGVFLIYPPENP